MFAAREGRSTLGIPKSVGEEFVGKAKDAIGNSRTAAGVMHVDPEGRVLLIRRRADDQNFAGHWDLPGGRADAADRSPKHTAARESAEETGILPDAKRMKSFSRRTTPRGLTYHAFVHPVDEAIEPKLSDEHDAHVWAHLDELPHPVHPGLVRSLQERTGMSEDLARSDWDELRRIFAEWTREEEKEGEHASDDLPPLYARKAEDAEQPRDDSGRFSSTPGGKTEYTHTTTQMTMTSEEKKKRKTAHEHAAYLKGLGHEGVKVTKRWQHHTIPGNVIGGTATYTTHHGYPKKAEDVSNGPEFKFTHASLVDGRNRSVASDSFALDRKSARTYSPDGHLHVASSPISKANVCEYFGREIPDAEGLGLQPDRKYRLLRHPDELKKAVPTFNNLPILSQHVPVTADEYPQELVIGSTGTDAAFDGTYLTNSLVFWPKEAIEEIENEEKKELSSAYRYRADMTPGRYEGAPYDGVMRDIVGNHVAKVKEGRAGSDVVVGDSKPPKFRIEQENPMTKKSPLSRKAELVRGALITFAAPLIAADSKLPDLAPQVRGLTDANFKTRKAKLLSGVASLIQPVLAKDASMEGLAELIDALEDVPAVEGKDAETAANGGVPVKKPGEDEEEDPHEGYKKIRERMKASGMDAEAIKACDDEMGYVPPAEDSEEENEEGETEPEPQPGKERIVKDKGAKDMVTKSAMDAAIKANVKIALDSAARAQRDLRDAERFVRPWVGDIAMAHDSADGVLRTAISTLKPDLDLTDVPGSALKAMLQLIPIPSKSRAETSVVAMDSAGAKSYADMFPATKRLSA